MNVYERAFKRIVDVIGVSGVLVLLFGGNAIVFSVYMVFLKAPSVVEVRPRLAEVDIITGVFSGQGIAYLYYHFPVLTSALVVVLVSGSILVWSRINV